MEQTLFDEAAIIVKMVAQYYESDSSDKVVNQYSTLLNNVSNRLEKFVSLCDSQPVLLAEETKIVLRECKGFLDALTDKGITKELHNRMLAHICLRIAKLDKWKEMKFNDAVFEICEYLTEPEVSKQSN